MKHKTPLQIIALLAIASLLTACGVPYRASSWGSGGYSSRDLDRNTVQVNYLTGRSAGTETIAKYVMYRSAEIALERGYDAFRLIDMNGFSVRGGSSYTSSVTAKVLLLKFSPEEITQAKAQTGRVPKTSPLEIGIFQKGTVYSAKEVKEKLESQIQRN